MNHGAVALALSLQLALPACAQGTAPTFTHTAGQSTYTLLGHDPAQAGTTTSPVVLVPITLTFAAKAIDGARASRVQEH